MGKNLLLAIGLIFMMQSMQAQSKLSRIMKRKTAEAALTLNGGFYGGTYYGLGTSIHYLWGMGRKRQTFNIGLGVRHMSFFANNREYETSDPTYYNTLLNGPDSVRFTKMNSNILNPYLATSIYIKRGVDLGINLDLFGITFGGTQKANFHSYELTLGKNEPVTIQPFAFNINDLGLRQYGYGSSVNQIYLNFRGGYIMRYRLGFDYFVNEIETKIPVKGNGYRFKNDNLMLSGAIVWNIRHNRDGNTHVWNFKERINK
jgi:hypothetical protein